MVVGWGSNRFHRESLWPSSESGRGGKEKERRREGGEAKGGRRGRGGWGGQHHEHNDKQKNFSVICGPFSSDLPESLQLPDTEKSLNSP